VAAKPTKYIKSEGNIGYGAGNNLGAENAQGEYLFILNPDTQLQSGALDILINFLDNNKNVAAVAPNLIDKSGKVFPQLGSLALTPLTGIVCHSFINKLFPDNPISRKFWLKDLPMSKKREVDAVPGAAFVVRKKVFDRVGKYDENMFLFFEESDIGKRIKETGYKLFIIPEAQVMHLQTLGRNSQKLKKHSMQSRFYYFKKHYGIFWAITVEMFARFSKWHAVVLFGILFCVIIHRFYT
jgi:GT2 family glycosyltransferase